MMIACITTMASPKLSHAHFSITSSHSEEGHQDANTHSTLSTSDQAEATMNLGNDNCLLLCVIEGETKVFPVDVKGPLWHNPKFMVGTLRKKIQEE